MTSHAGSHYVNRAAARQAIEMTRPMIEAALTDRSIVGSGFLCIVIMDPALSPPLASFDDAVLLEEAYGDRAAWDADYAAFARAKARLSWLHGMDSHWLQTLHPQLLRGGDSLLWGSVCLDGIVVAASGAFPWYDEAFAGSVAHCLRAIAKGQRENETTRLQLL